MMIVEVILSQHRLKSRDGAYCQLADIRLSLSNVRFRESSGRPVDVRQCLLLPLSEHRCLTPGPLPE